MKQFRLVFCLAALLICLFARGVPEASADESIHPYQAGATDTSVTIAWQKVSGAAYYNFQAVSLTDGTISPISRNQTETVSVIGPVPRDTVFRYIVFAFDADGRQLGRSFVYEAATAPGPVVTCSAIEWNEQGTMGTFGILFNPYPNTLSGFEWEIRDIRNERVLCSGSVSEGVLGFTAKLKTNQVYSLRVRGMMNNSGRIFYGSWTTAAVVPEPRMMRPRYIRKKQAVRLTWRKVAGAKCYSVYVSDKKNSGFKRVAVVRGSRTSCLLKKRRGLPLRPGKTYYFRIRARRGKDKSTGNLTKSVTIPAAQPPL